MRLSEVWSLTQSFPAKFLVLNWLSEIVDYIRLVGDVQRRKILGNTEQLTWGDWEALAINLVLLSLVSKR